MSISKERIALLDETCQTLYAYENDLKTLKTLREIIEEDSTKKLDSEQYKRLCDYKIMEMDRKREVEELDHKFWNNMLLIIWDREE